MAYEVNIENHGAGVVVTLTGIITGRDLIKVNQYIYDADPDKKLRYQIWDFNEVEILEIKTEDIQILVLQDVDEAHSNSNQSVAIIGSLRTLQGIDSTYRYLSDYWVKTGFQSKSFSNMAAARDWIANVPPPQDRKM